MTDNEITYADAALRERLHELHVHIRCGGVRGPVRRDTYGPRRWQSCGCEDNPVRWPMADVSRQTDLCIVCLRGTAGGVSRWAWLACEHCRKVNSIIARTWGGSLPLGRHSLMNRAGVRLDAPPAERTKQVARLSGFVGAQLRLRQWRLAEYRRLASRFDPQADVPLRIWQQEYPPSPEASWDAFSRMMAADFPVEGPRDPGESPT